MVKSVKVSNINRFRMEVSGEIRFFHKYTSPSDPSLLFPALQIAPYDMDYKWPNATGTYDLGTRWASELNAYRGGIYQQVWFQTFPLMSKACTR